MKRIKVIDKTKEEAVFKDSYTNGFYKGKSGILVLACDKAGMYSGCFSGIVVHSPKGAWSTGHNASDWYKESFTPVNVKIIIK